jgi:adenylate cyclase
MGSDQRFDYTVLGDIVNLSSRLEGQTKSYGVTTIISSNTFLKVKDKGDDIIELDKIQVKGKSEPETIYGLFQTKLTIIERKTQEDFLKAYRKGDYSNSSIYLQELINLKQNLATYAEIMEERIKIYKSKGFPKNWNGVFIATEK